MESGSGTTTWPLTTSATFGATTAFLEQLHLKMVREQVSFAGESDVLVGCAKQRGLASRLPWRLGLSLSQRWYMWRLSLRTEDSQKRRHQDTVVDLMRNVEDLVAERWNLFAEDLDATTASTPWDWHARRRARVRWQRQEPAVGVRGSAEAHHTGCV